jgi:hypothetical protein
MTEDSHIQKLVKAESLDERIVQYSDGTYELQTRTSKGWEPVVLNCDSIQEHINIARKRTVVSFATALASLLAGYLSPVLGSFFLLTSCVMTAYTIYSILFESPKRRTRTPDPQELFPKSPTHKRIYDIKGNFVVDIEE